MLKSGKHDSSMHLSKRISLFSVALLGNLSFLNAEEMRPNFLFIGIDDLKPVLGSMAEDPGNFLQTLYPDSATRERIKGVLTPNIDRLAAEGVNFHRAYCPSSVCRPSRTALLTGYRPHVSGITGNGDGYFRLPDKPGFLREVVTLPQYLRANGYQAAGTGKLFHTGGDDEADPDYSWDTWFNHAPAPADKGQRRQSEWSPPRQLKAKMIFGTDAGPVEGQPDYGSADLIATLLETGSATVGGRSFTLDPDKPFFLGCGIFRPHLPHFAPQELVDLFDTADMGVTMDTLDAFFQDLDDVPVRVVRDRDSGPLGEVLKYGKEYGSQLGMKNGDLHAYKEALKHYLASTALADRCVKRLLDALEKSPYANNTVIVLWSDHGWYLGEKYLFLKTRVWDEAANCVLVLKDPRQGKQAAGASCYQPVNLQDLYPTIVSMAGLERPDHLAGIDISPLMVDPGMEWGVPSLTTWGDGEAIRYQNWAYLRYGKDTAVVELYDVRKDPDELTNLAGDKAYRDVLRDLDALLERALAGERFGR